MISDVCKANGHNFVFDDKKEINKLNIKTLTYFFYHCTKCGKTIIEEHLINCDVIK